MFLDPDNFVITPNHMNVWVLVPFSTNWKSGEWTGPCKFEDSFVVSSVYFIITENIHYQVKLLLFFI